jgi:hypothetical protein
VPVPRVVRASRGNARRRSDSPSTRPLGLSGRQDVLRHIPLAIVVPAASRAVPFPDPQGQVLQNMPTVKTAPARGVEAVGQPRIPPVPPALVLQHPPEFAERRVGDRAGKGVVLDRDAAGVGAELTGPSHREPAQAREREWVTEGVPLEGRSGILGGLLPGLPLERGRAGPLLEEVAEGPLQMPERLLGGDRGPLSQPGMIGLALEPGQESAPLAGRDRAALLGPGGGPKPESPVVDIPTGAQDPGKHLARRPGRNEAESVPRFHGFTNMRVWQNLTREALSPPPQGSGLRASN